MSYNTDTETIPEAKFIIDRMSEVISYISFQGNIGAGKSTGIKGVKRYIERHRLSALVDINKDLFSSPTPPPSFRTPLNCSTSGDSICSSSDDTLENTSLSPSVPIKDITQIGRDYFIVIDEPVDEWSSRLYSLSKKHTASSEGKDKKKTILQIFYDDMERYGFLFQIKAFTSRLKRIVNELSKIPFYGSNNSDLPGSFDVRQYPRIHIIAERSLRTDRLFFKNLYDNEIISQAEWENYNEFYDLICNEIIKKENIMIYIHTNTNTCHQRIITRSREGEGNKNKVVVGEDEEKVVCNKKNEEGVFLLICLLFMIGTVICSGLLYGFNIVLSATLGSMIWLLTVLWSEVMTKKEEKEKENTIPKEYLESLEKCHNEMIEEFKQLETNRVIEVDFNKDMNEKEIDNIIESLMDNILDIIKV